MKKLELTITIREDKKANVYDPPFTLHYSRPGHGGTEIDGNSLYELMRFFAGEVGELLDSTPEAA